MRAPTLSITQRRKRDALRAALEELRLDGPLEDFNDERFVGTYREG